MWSKMLIFGNRLRTGGNKMDSLNEVLLREGYSSPHALIKDWALIVALSKVEQYRADCDFFQKKYNMSMEEFESSLHRETGSEDFEKEDDINDWEFSLEAQKWWEKKIRELQDAADN